MNASTYKAKALAQLIADDVKELKHRPELNKYFNSIKEVRPISSEADGIASVWARFVKAKPLAQPIGQYKLELLYISQNDDGLKAIVQYHFVDLKSGDSVEEFARYYDLKSLL